MPVESRTDAQGAGPYDDVAIALRKELGANAVAILVLDGVKGNGFASDSQTGLSARDLAKALREVAARLEAMASERPPAQA